MKLEVGTTGVLGLGVEVGKVEREANKMSLAFAYIWARRTKEQCETPIGPHSSMLWPLLSIVPRSIVAE